MSLIERNLSEFPNTEQPSPGLSALPATRGLLRAFVASHGGVLDERAQRGLVKECHADLRAEHVILRPELSV